MNSRSLLYGLQLYRCVYGNGMGIEFMGTGGNGNVKSHSRTSLAYGLELKSFMQQVSCHETSANSPVRALAIMLRHLSRVG